MRNTINRIDKKYKYSFGSVCVVGLLTHMFMFTNLLPGNDQTVFFFNLGNTVPFGRWGLYLLEARLPLIDTSIATCYAAPWVKGIVSICLLGAVSCVIVAILDIKETSICVLLGAVIVTFPSVAAILSYMFTAPAYFLGLLLACAGVYVTKKNHNGKISRQIMAGGSVLIMLSMSIYQSFVCFAIGLFVADLLLCCLDRRTTFFFVLKKSLYYFFWLTCGIVLYCMSVQFIIRIFGIQLSSYRGLADVLTGGVGNMVNVMLKGIGEAYNSFLDVPIPIAETLRLRRILYWCTGAAAALQISYLLWRYKIYRKQKWIMLLILIVLFPVASNSVYLMGATQVTTLMEYGGVTTILLTLALVQQFYDSVKEEGKKWKKYLFYSTYLSVLLLSHQYFLITNEAYSRQYFTYEQTYGYMNRVAYEIQSCEGYTADTPVMLYGNIVKEVVMPEFAKLDTISGIFGESALVNGYSREEFIRHYCGLPIVRASEPMREEIRYTQEFADMPLYPAEGAVKIVDGCCVVKFSE